MERTDADLIRRLPGDAAAFAELVARYQGAVRGFAALWAPSRDEGEDIAQEVFLAALRSAPSFDPTRDLKTWLLGIARNLARQAWRRVGRKGAGETLDRLLEHHALAVFQDRERRADRRRGAMTACFEALPDRDRALFRRYIIEDEPGASLAAAMRTTEATVRAVVSRIRKRLRACVEGKLQGGTA